MSRPEHTAPPEIFYNEEMADKYASSSRMMEIQSTMTERAVELLNVPEDSPPLLLLDLGCGSGLSGDILSEMGHQWVGLDISSSMLRIARQREVEGDVCLRDLGQGLPFRPGTFDGAISISALQWLCNADKAEHNPIRRLRTFFETLFAVLKRSARVVFQLYPETPQQMEMITAAAMRAGFTGGLVVDYPNSTKAKKYYLTLFAGPAPPNFKEPKALGTEDGEQHSAQFTSEREGGRGRKRRHQETKGRDWILQKKEYQRKIGKDFEEIHNAYTVLSDEDMRRVYDLAGEAGVEHLRTAQQAHSRASHTAAAAAAVAASASAAAPAMSVPVPPPATASPPPLGNPLPPQQAQQQQQQQQQQQMPQQMPQQPQQQQQQQGGYLPQYVADLIAGKATRPYKASALVHRLHVSLEDMYNGATLRFGVRRDVPCPACAGLGGTTTVRCPQCAGAPGASAFCTLCSGDGEVALPQYRCTACNGARTVKAEHCIQVKVERGMAHEQRITYSNQGDQKPGSQPGDLVLVLEQAPHARFSRSGDDLVTTCELSLREALCGYTLVVPRLDGRPLVLRSPAGKVTRPDDVLVVAGEGMPLHRKPLAYGRLIVRLRVAFPSDGSLGPPLLHLLETVLPPARDAPHCSAPTDRDAPIAAGAFSHSSSAAHRRVVRAAQHDPSGDEAIADSFEDDSDEAAGASSQQRKRRRSPALQHSGNCASPAPRTPVPGPEPVAAAASLAAAAGAPALHAHYVQQLPRDGCPGMPWDFGKAMP
eukprot:m51a1_g8750 putative uncharacterized methyltransferase wbscr22-like (763) ;mRNA; f:85347-89972